MSPTRHKPAAGTLREGTHCLPVRVYWEDTDAGGIVYHASYVRFMERGRTELLRAAGLGQSALRNEHGLLFVVAEMRLKFRAPARLDDSLLVCTHCTTIRAASLILAQSVLRDDEVLAEAEVICAGVGPDGRPRRAPPTVRQRLSELATG